MTPPATLVPPVASNLQAIKEAVALRVEFDDEIIRLEGRLDSSTAPSLVACLDLIGLGTIVLDLSDLTFIDAGGIRTVADAASRLGANGYLINTRGAQGLVRHAFELAGRSDLLTNLDAASLEAGT